MSPLATRSPSIAMPAARVVAARACSRAIATTTSPSGVVGTWRHFPTLSYHLLATDGGTTSTLLDAQLLRLEGSALAPHDRLTVGGNDLLGAYGDTRRAREVVSVVRRRVGQALVRVRSAMRQRSDPVIVGAVYDPSDGTGDASRVGLPPWPQVVDILAELNVALHGVAAEHGAQVADIHGHFLGHGLRAGNPAQSDPRPADRNLWFCNVIEPKPGEPARCARHSGTPCTEPGEAQYRSPHPSPQRAQRPDRAQGADEGNWQATTAPAGGNL